MIQLIVTESGVPAAAVTQNKNVLLKVPMKKVFTVLEDQLV